VAEPSPFTVRSWSNRGRICVGRLSSISRTLERRGRYLYQSVDSWVSPCGRVSAWVFHIIYRNVSFMIERSCGLGWAHPSAITFAGRVPLVAVRFFFGQIVPL
jgi:hypothetical protein